MKRARLLVGRMRPRPMVRSCAKRRNWPQAVQVWRARRRRALALARPAQLAVHHTWLSRLSLEFNLPVAREKAGPGAKRPASSATAIPGSLRGTYFQSLLRLDREVLARTHRAFAQRLERELVVRMPSTRGLQWRATIIANRPRGEPGRTVTAWRRAVIVPAVSRARAPGARPGRSATWRPMRALLPQWRAVPLPVPRRHEFAPGRAVPLAEKRAPKLHRATDLVWRAAPDEQATGAANISQRMLNGSATTIPAALPGVAAPIPAAIDDKRAQLLDPALVERLADDVMGRVEKRIRIERERRGV